VKANLAAGDALIFVDVQNDFLPGGSLAVPAGNEIIPILNRYIALFHAYGLAIFATRDWHPPDHCSFIEQGGRWPPHCIEASPGAAFPASLEFPCDIHIISKATTREKDAYSGFADTPLNALLKSSGIGRVFIGGLATEYCVLNTVKDALQLGYATFILTDAVRAINSSSDDGPHALEEMERLGAVPIHFEAISA
jgi:nicotinamidase/pyrazinamidase